MGQTQEEHRKNYKEKIYHLQVSIPCEDGIYRGGYWRFTGYRTARQALDAIRDIRGSISSWGNPWKFRIKIVK